MWVANDTILLPLHIILCRCYGGFLGRHVGLLLVWVGIFFLFDHFLYLGPIVDTSVKFHSCSMVFMVAMRLLGGASSHWSHIRVMHSCIKRMGQALRSSPGHNLAMEWSMVMKFSGVIYYTKRLRLTPKPGVWHEFCKIEWTPYYESRSYENIVVFPFSLAISPIHACELQETLKRGVFTAQLEEIITWWSRNIIISFFLLLPVRISHCQWLHAACILRWKFCS